MYSFTYGITEMLSLLMSAITFTLALILSLGIGYFLGNWTRNKFKKEK